MLQLILALIYSNYMTPGSSTLIDLRDLNMVVYMHGIAKKSYAIFCGMWIFMPSHRIYYLLQNMLL